MNKVMNSAEVTTMVTDFLSEYKEAVVEVKTGGGEMAIKAHIQGYRTIRGNNKVAKFHLAYADATAENVTERLNVFMRFYFA